MQWSTRLESNLVGEQCDGCGIGRRGEIHWRRGNGVDCELTGQWCEVDDAHLIAENAETGIEVQASHARPPRRLDSQACPIGHAKRTMSRNRPGH